MASAQLDNLKSEILTLGESERAQLALEIVASLDGPKEEGIKEAWDVEICRRINEIELGRATSFDADSVLSDLRRKIHRQ